MLPENPIDRNDGTPQRDQEDIVSAPTTRPPEPAHRANGTPASAGPANTSTSQPKKVAPQQMTGAQAVIRSLEELDVDVIFGIPGGAVLPVYDFDPGAASEYEGRMAQLFDQGRHLLGRQQHPRTLLPVRPTWVRIGQLPKHRCRPAFSTIAPD